MTGIDSWSTTPATNATADAGAINWAEGQAPSTVNNTARQMLADIRSALNDPAWFQYGTGDQGAGNIAVPAVYASGTSFTIAGADVTAAYHVGRRLRAVGVSTGTIYGKISVTSYSPTTTTITAIWDSGSLSNETLVISLSQIPLTGRPVPQLPNTYSGALTGPFATLSTTYVMAGLGATMAITPISTGRIRMLFSGTMLSNTAFSDCFINGRYNTGAAPALGAAVTGTAASIQELQITIPASSGCGAFSYYAEVSSLTLGTAYWFDLTFHGTSGQSAQLQKLTGSLQEF